MKKDYIYNVSTNGQIASGNDGLCYSDAHKPRAQLEQSVPFICRASASSIRTGRQSFHVRWRALQFGLIRRPSKSTVARHRRFTGMPTCRPDSRLSNEPAVPWSTQTLWQYPSLRIIQRKRKRDRERQRGEGESNARQNCIKSDRFVWQKEFTEDLIMWNEKLSEKKLIKLYNLLYD